MMTLVKTNTSGNSLSKVKSPVSSSRAGALCATNKAVSPLTPPLIRSPKAGATASAMSPSTTNGASPSLNSYRASPAASKPATPLSSARAVPLSVAKPSSASATPRTGATPRSSVVAAVPERPRTPTTSAAVLKVPMLRLHGSISPSPSIDRRLVPTHQQQADGVGIAKKAKPCITVKRQDPSLIFKKADTPRAPGSNAFASKHIHSDPFAKERQQPITPKISQRTSVPRPLDNVSSPSTRTTGRKVGALDKTNPICQDDPTSIARGRSPSSGRSHGVCAPPSKALSPTSWEGATFEGATAVHVGKRCNSAPASSRCADDLPRRGISVTNTKYGGSLKGVWVPESRPTKAVQVRAPYAQMTPRASTPSATPSRKLSAPFATNTPRGGATGPKRTAPSSITAPYHTTTPRGAPVRSTFTTHAPFHTNTPRGARPVTPTHSLKNIIQ